MITTEGYPDPTVDAVIGNISREKHQQPRKPLVYICSPFAGQVEKNSARARRYSRFAADQGVVPLAPHLLFPQFLNDADPEERSMAMRMNCVILKRCDEVWVFGSRLTPGMAREVRFAQRMNKIIRYFTEEGELRT